MVELVEPHVVVAVDGTHRSAGAIRYAATQAVARGLPLQVLHVSPGALPVSPMLPCLPLHVEPTGRAILGAAASAAQEVNADLPVLTELVVGGRIAEIVVRSAHADLLVLGHETRHGLDRFLTGTTVGSVVSRALCPVAVVQEDWTWAHAQGRLVVGVESADDAPRLLEVAFIEARRRHAAVTVLHAWDIPEVYKDLIADRVRDVAWTGIAIRRIEQLTACAGQGDPPVSVEIKVVQGRPGSALVHASATADVVLLLRHGRRLLPGPHLGSTARAVIASATTVVEIVPATPLEPGRATLARERSDP